MIWTALTRDLVLVVLVLVVHFVTSHLWWTDTCCRTEKWTCSNEVIKWEQAEIKMSAWTCWDLLNVNRLKKKKKCIKLHFKKEKLVHDMWPASVVCFFFPAVVVVCARRGQLAAPQTGWRFVVMRPEAEGPDYRQTKHCCVLLGSGAEHRFKN